MHEDEIKKLFGQFEKASTVENGIQFWSARDLYPLLGYIQWRNFLTVIDKAKEACITVGVDPFDHFADITKRVSLGSGAEREIDDVYLTRYACYLIAQNGNPRKPQIAFAQTYFAVQTRRAELIEKRIKELERIEARHSLQNSENTLSGILYERGVDEKGFAIIRSKGDQALFNLSTKQLKRKMGVPEKRPVADFLSTVNIQAKDLAAGMTTINVQAKDLRDQSSIEEEHIDNNSAVREMLKKRGIYPENQPVEEDIRIVERRQKSENKKASQIDQIEGHKKKGPCSLSEETRDD